MNIKDVKTAFKIADVVLDDQHEKNHIKLITYLIWWMKMEKN